MNVYIFTNYKRFGADKYPKLKAFKHGNFWEYEGEYTTAGKILKH